MKDKILTKEEDYKRRVDLVVSYVREHLDEIIDLQTLADLSSFSPFHFHRIIKAWLGEPIGAFITRTRVETAARLLRYSDMSITDIAYSVGYEMPSSLTKSFTKLFNVSPLQYRKDKNYYVMKEQLPSQSVKLSRIKIVELEPKTVFYISAKGMYDPKVFGLSYEKMWNEVKQQNVFSAGIEHLGLYYNNPKITEHDKIMYDVCLRVCKPIVPNGEIGVKQIEGGKYAVFTYIGDYEKIGKAYDMIYGEKIAQAGCELRSNFCFEKYISDPRRVEPEKRRSEIYIPIL